MTYTTDQAIALAREVYEDESKDHVVIYVFDADDITALCNKVRQQTLLEAAEYFDGDWDSYVAGEQRRMVEGE